MKYDVKDFLIDMVHFPPYATDKPCWFSEDLRTFLKIGSIASYASNVEKAKQLLILNDENYSRSSITVKGRQHLLDIWGVFAIILTCNSKSAVVLSAKMQILKMSASAISKLDNEIFEKRKNDVESFHKHRQDRLEQKKHKLSLQQKIIDRKMKIIEEEEDMFGLCHMPE